MARRLLKISRHSTRPDDVGNFFAPRFMENWFLQVQQCRHIWGGRNGWFGNYFSIKYTLYDWSKLNELFNWLHAIAYRLWLNVISYRKKLFHNTNWTHIPNAIFTLIQMPQLEKKLESDLTVDSKVVACRFPFPSWKADDVIGEGIDSVWVYKPIQSKSSVWLS